MMPMYVNRTYMYFVQVSCVEMHIWRGKVSERELFVFSYMWEMSPTFGTWRMCVCRSLMCRQTCRGKGSTRENFHACAKRDLNLPCDIYVWHIFPWCRSLVWRCTSRGKRSSGDNLFRYVKKDLNMWIGVCVLCTGPLSEDDIQIYVYVYIYIYIYIYVYIYIYTYI